MDRTALNDFEQFAQENFTITRLNGPSATGPESDPEIRLSTSIAFPSAGSFYLNALRVKRDDEGLQVIDSRDGDSMELDSVLSKLQDTEQATFVTRTFGDDEYVVYILPHCN